MIFIQPLTLLTSSNAKWTATQEKTISQDYPFTDLHLETADQFVLRIYLQFLWLPESIMPLGLLVSSFRRVQDASPSSPDSPHSLHALLDPLLLSVRAVVTKYHTDLPHILAQEGGDGDPEESMMWYALSYEMSEVGDGNTCVNNEDAIMLEEKSRKMWLQRLEKREVQIQILLYFLKLSLPGPCAPLPSVKILANDAIPSIRKHHKNRTKVVVPSVHERLESFMDKLCMWQLVKNMDDLNEQRNKDERDWMQTFCENVVERQFKSSLPDLCALLRSKLFPHSPFSDEGNDSDAQSSPESQVSSAPQSRPNRKLARSSTSSSVSQAKSKPNPKPIKRSDSVLSESAARSRSRSLSVSLAQDASQRRSNSASGTSSSLKRALGREVSMSRGFKPRAQQSQPMSQPESSSTRVPTKMKKEAKKEEKHSQGVTLVAATPVKPKARGDTKNYELAESQGRLRAPSFDAHMEDGDDVGDIDPDVDDLPVVMDEDEELWLPNSSPNIVLLCRRKRTASCSSSSVGLSDPNEEGVDTPVKKRLRI